MKFSWKKLISLAFVVIFAVSCLTMTASAADTQAPAGVDNAILQAVTFIFGEDAVVDGNIDMDKVLHVLYYKDSPLILKLLDIIYAVFWDVLLFIMNLFVK